MDTGTSSDNMNGMDRLKLQYFKRDRSRISHRRGCRPLEAGTNPIFKKKWVHTGASPWIFRCDYTRLFYSFVIFCCRTICAER